MVFGQSNIGLMRVSPDGGTPEALVRLEAGDEVYGLKARCLVDPSRGKRHRCSISGASLAQRG